jgi:hypothetical protein
LETDLSEEILQGTQNDELIYIQNHKIPGVLEAPIMMPF